MKRSRLHQSMSGFWKGSVQRTFLICSMQKSSTISVPYGTFSAQNVCSFLHWWAQHFKGQPQTSDSKYMYQLQMSTDLFAFAGHDDVVNYLLHHFRRLRIDQCNQLGFTALMKASIQGRTRCAKHLLFAGKQLRHGRVSIVALYTIHVQLRAALKWA